MNELTDIRNNLYDSIPTGELNAWDLIIIIKEHLTQLDEYIDKQEKNEKISNNTEN